MIELTYDDIQSIDLTPLSSIITSNDEYKKYFLGDVGREHYKLLAYISSLYDDISILDIGTNRGFSALALSYNKLNKVHSFDLYELKELKSPLPDNITFYINNILNEEYKDLILKSKIILVDTFHDGSFEKKFHSYLNEINYKGILLLDDIKLNDKMIDYWDSIEEEKKDISKVGHWSGTGLVIFK